MVGQEKKKTLLAGGHGDDLIFAKELNNLHDRFDKSDFNTERNLVRQQLKLGQEVIITAGVCQTFKGINTKKAAGPDRLTARALKECREELSFVYSHLFKNLT